MTGRAKALAVTPSTPGRMCDRLLAKRLIRRPPVDRLQVPVSITMAGQQMADRAAKRRAVLIAGILGRLPALQHSAAIASLSAFAASADEVSDDQWPVEVAVPPEGGLAMAADNARKGPAAALVRP